jgi:hypothetical protein
LNAWWRSRFAKWIVVIGAIVLAMVTAAIWRIGVIAMPHETGYFAPVFTPDGKSVLAISREVRAIVTGFGWEFFTPPASVRLVQDRFRLVSIRVADGGVTILETFPPSPLEGARFTAYHGAIFGVPHAHLRWPDPDHLEYEIAVTRHQPPLARTFVVRRVWNPTSQAYETSVPWEEAPTRMAGDEPSQLHGDTETIAVPGDELMPCAIALLNRDGSAPNPLVQTAACRRKYPAGISSAVLMPISRRADIERIETIQITYADLVARGRRSGVSEGQAMLDANKEMQRLGLYPKTTTLVADPAGCESASPLFPISDMEFTVGLFQDIEAAIKSPGTEVDKAMGAYIIHRDYSTSRQINEYLDAGRSNFFVRAHGACWRMTIHQP